MQDAPSFSIRPEHVAGAAAAAPDAAPVSAAGSFSNPTQAVAFLAAIAGQGLADQATCWRSPDGAAWLVAMAVSSAQAAPLVWAAGGRPYTRKDDGWHEVPVVGGAAAGAFLEIGNWDLVTLPELLAGLVLRSRRGAPPVTGEVGVLVPGALGRWVLRRAVTLGICAQVWGSERRPLDGPDPAEGVLWIRLRADRGSVPRALVKTLCRLPYVLVGTFGGSGCARLLVDVRQRLPLAHRLIASLVPESEIWALGGPEIGHWRLTLKGEGVDAADFLLPPDLTAPRPGGGSGDLKSSLEKILKQPVRLVPRRGLAGHADAVLLDPTELSWLARFLRGRPWAERAFVIVGAGHALLTAPGGLSKILPFGLPLRHVGPGGFYLEAQVDLDPPLPEAARRRLFDLERGHVVALTERGGYRFDVDQLVPAWTLWVGEGPEVQEAFDPTLLAQLGAMSTRAMSARAMQAAEQEAALARNAVAPELPSSHLSRAELLEQAQYAELLGDLLRAAELLEQAGEAGAAGLLYERAAQET